MASKNHNDLETKVTVAKTNRVLYFSDGVHEEIEEEKASEVDSAPQESHINPKTLSWGPWFSYYTWKSGKKVLNAVDSAGESLAGFFGITTPKYQIEIDEYERMQEEKKKMEDESAGWVPKPSDGDIPLVLNEPPKLSPKTEEP